MSHHHHSEKHEPRELAAFLKANTRATHQSVDDLVMSVQPFSTPENYTRFLQLQAVFHKIVDDVYKNPTLNQHIDGLAALARYDDVITDLRDLNAQEAHIRAAIPAPQATAHATLPRTWMGAANTGASLSANSTNYRSPQKNKKPRSKARWKRLRFIKCCCGRFLKWRKI